MRAGARFLWAGEDSAGRSLKHRVGKCSAVTLPPFVVADGFITYHHVKPAEMVLLHQAVSYYKVTAAGDAQLNGSTCTGALPLSSGQAFRRCNGLLCPPPR